MDRLWFLWLRAECGWDGDDYEDQRRHNDDDGIVDVSRAFEMHTVCLAGCFQNATQVRYI